jgi:nucleoside-diphosphate-sugar epimerase
VVSSTREDKYLLPVSHCPSSALISIPLSQSITSSNHQFIMTRVLLTGGSGFIAAHVLSILLEHGHSVVTTVRSQEKANKIKEAYPNASEKDLSFAIVEDIAQQGAFDKAVVSDPPFEAVIHTASPFHFNVTDIQKVISTP